MDRCSRPRPHHRHDWTGGTCPGRPFPVQSVALHVAVLRALVTRT